MKYILFFVSILAANISSADIRIFETSDIIDSWEFFVKDLNDLNSKSRIDMSEAELLSKNNSPKILKSNNLWSGYKLIHKETTVRTYKNIHVFYLVNFNVLNKKSEVVGTAYCIVLENGNIVYPRIRTDI